MDVEIEAAKFNSEIKKLVKLLVIVAFFIFCEIILIIKGISVDRLFYYITADISSGSVFKIFTGLSLLMGSVVIMSALPVFAVYLITAIVNKRPVKYLLQNGTILFVYKNSESKELPLQNYKYYSLFDTLYSVNFELYKDLSFFGFMKANRLIVKKEMEEEAGSYLSSCLEEVDAKELAKKFNIWTVKVLFLFFLTLFLIALIVSKFN